MRFSYAMWMEWILIVCTAIETLFVLGFWDQIKEDPDHAIFLFSSASIFGILRWCSPNPIHASMTHKAFLLLILCTFTIHVRATECSYRRGFFYLRIVWFLIGVVVSSIGKRVIEGRVHIVPVRDHEA